EPPIDLRPLRFSNPSHVKMFADFLTGYFNKVQEVVGIQNMANVLTAHNAACLLEISKGILGVACNVIKEAVHIATVAGSSEVTEADLATATQRSVVDM